MKFNTGIWHDAIFHARNIEANVIGFLTQYFQVNEVQWAQRIVIVIVAAFILITSLISHIQIKQSNIAMAKEILRRTGKQTLGGRIFFYCVIAFCAFSFWYGFTAISSVFAVAALVCERLIVYRVCRGRKDPVSRFLTKINW